MDKRPVKQDFGLSFNYAVWDADTELTLASVPWNNDYRDVVWFDTTEKLNQYLDTRANPEWGKITGTYAKPFEPVLIDLPFNIAARHNYLRAFNPAVKSDSRDVARYFYYFITGVEYVNPSTTRLTLQIDLWQTYIRQVQFGRCFVERGHIGIANQDNFRNFGRDYLTIPEGLDVGGEYVNVTNREIEVMDSTQNGYDILVCATADLINSRTLAKGIRSATGSIFHRLPSGANYYVWPNGNSFLKFLKDVSHKPWITESIISITLIPKLSRYFPGVGYAYPSAIGSIPTPQQLPNAKIHKLFTNWRNSSEILGWLPSRYRHLKKFLTYPYTVIEATTWSGTPIILKPESWNTPDAAFRELVSLTPPDQRIVFAPQAYNARTMNNVHPRTDDYIDIATQITNFPKMAIVNNGGLSYLASNSNSIAYQYQSADWAQQKALRGAQVGYEQAGMGLEAARQLTSIGISGDASSVAIANRLAQENALYGGLGNIAGGATTGAFAGPIGALAGGATAGVGAVLGQLATNRSISAANEQFANRASGAMATQGVNNAAGNYLRDSNLGLAQFAAKGDYENARAGILAKTQDARMIQPTVSGQVGGESFNLVNDNMRLTAKWKMPDQNVIAQIGEYWLKYGYAVQRPTFIPNDFMVMTRFTYWKMSDTYIRAAMIPEGFKQALRGMFEKGVTVYRNPDDIGWIDPADNDPLEGITLDGYTPPDWEPEPDIEPEPETRKRKKKMVVFGTSDAGVAKFAFAGSSPGTNANWQETTSETRAQDYLDAIQQERVIALDLPEWEALKLDYLAPVMTDSIA